MQMMIQSFLPVKDEFEWHVNNPELSQRENYGLAHYADDLKVQAV